MNLFRSEEHIRNWTRFDPAAEEGIVSLPDLVRIFSVGYFRKRLDSNWVSNSGEYRREIIGALKEIGKSGPFWKRPKS